MWSFWLNDGKVVVDDAQHPIYCEECPCATEDDCYADVILAIRKRQTAMDRDVWSEVPEPAKSLADCIEEVNAFAEKFISGTYTGGTGSYPALRTDSYASGAADFCELYELLKALVTSYHGTSAISEEKSIGFGQDSGGEEPWYEALDAALANFTYVGGATPKTTSSYIGYRWGNTSWEAEYVSSAYRLSVPTQPTTISHVIRAFVTHNGLDEYDDCGFDIPPLGQFGLVDTINAGFTNVVETNFIGNQYDASSGGYATYGGDRYTWYRRGYGTLYAAFVLIDWTFNDP